MEGLGKLLREHPFCSGMSPEEIDFLAGCAKNIRVRAGEFLMREGDETGAVYLVRSGRVALELHQPHREPVQIETLEEGSILGWSCLFPPYRWHVDARILETMMVFVVDGACLRGKMDADPSFGYAITRRLLYHVHQRLERLRLQQLDVYGGPSAS